MTPEQQKKDFEKTASKVFNTLEGKRILAYWKMCVVDPSALQDTPELTYYSLGQKEFVQNLLLLIKDSVRFEEISKEIQNANIEEAEEYNPYDDV